MRLTAGARSGVASVAVLASVLVVPVPAAASAAGSTEQLREYAGATWASFVAMTDPSGGLPTDSCTPTATRSVQTSTTNIGAYMWSARRRRAARHHRPRRAGQPAVDDDRDARAHGAPQADGQFYNWYDHRDGAKLTTWPPTGAPLDPILSSVDNGWLATGLRIVRSAACRSCRRAPARSTTRWTSASTTVPDVNRILFHYAPDTGDGAVLLRHRRLREPDRRLHRHRQGRAAAQGVLRPLAHASRTPATTRWQETRPSASPAPTTASTSTTALPLQRTRVTPSWGGSMFEALMPALFVPEERWGAGSWRQNHPLTVRRADRPRPERRGYGCWGFSPSNIPEGGYSGVRRRRDRHGPERQPVQRGQHARRPRLRRLPGPRRRSPTRRRRAYTNGVVTPHAAFLALRYRPAETLANLAPARGDSRRCTGSGASATRSTSTPASVSDAYLSLDQGMIMAAIGNALGDDVLRDALRHAGLRAGDPAGARRRGVQRPPARLHDHRHRRRRPPRRARAATT